MLAVNTKAPDFKLLDQNGDEHKLSDYRGKKIVLYFYPKDNTSGCSKQACGFNDLVKDYEDKNAVILGVSKDSVKSHKKFETNYSLGFTLLSNETIEVLEAYDVWKEKSMYGKKYMGVVRTTYIIDEQGTIVKAFEKVNASTNPLDMLKEL